MESQRETSRVRLSSPITPVIKFIWTPWILLFCALAVYAMVENGAPWFVVLGVAFFALCIFSIAVTTYWPLRRVEADNIGLWVKHGRRTVFVPYSQIWRISTMSQGFLLGFPMIQVKTREPTAFGGAFLFIPIVTTQLSPAKKTASWLEDRVRETRLV